MAQTYYTAITFDHPLDLLIPRLEGPIDPPLLPREELNELDRTNQLIQNAHPCILCFQHPFLNTNTPFRKIAIQRPSEEKHNESSEGRESEQLIQENRADNNLHRGAVQKVQSLARPMRTLTIVNSS